MKQVAYSIIGIAGLLLFHTACKKDCGEERIGLLLPAVQKIRESANRSWQKEKGFMQKMEIPFSSSIKPEFGNFKTDTAILVSCWLKFKDNPKTIPLPYSFQMADGNRNSYYAEIFQDKAFLYYHNSSGTADPIPTDIISFNFTRVE